MFGPFPEEWPGSQEAPRGGPAATRYSEGQRACLSSSLIVGDRGQNPAVRSTRALPVPPPPGTAGKESGPFILTDQALGLCMDIRSLDTPSGITGLPVELAAATLARILRQGNALLDFGGHFESNGEPGR